MKGMAELTNPFCDGATSQQVPHHQSSEAADWKNPCLGSCCFHSADPLPSCSNGCKHFISHHSFLHCLMPLHLPAAFSSSQWSTAKFLLWEQQPQELLPGISGNEGTACPGNRKVVSRTLPTAHHSLPPASGLPTFLGSEQMQEQPNLSFVITSP